MSEAFLVLIILLLSLSLVAFPIFALTSPGLIPLTTLTVFVSAGVGIVISVAVIMLRR